MYSQFLKTEYQILKEKMIADKQQTNVSLDLEKCLLSKFEYICLQDHLHIKYYASSFFIK